MGFVNCLLMCSVFCLSVVAVLLSKVMVMFKVFFCEPGRLMFSRVCGCLFCGNNGQ